MHMHMHMGPTFLITCFITNDTWIFLRSNIWGQISPQTSPKESQVSLWDLDPKMPLVLVESEDRLHHKLPLRFGLEVHVVLRFVLEVPVVLYCYHWGLNLENENWKKDRNQWVSLSKFLDPLARNLGLTVNLAAILQFVIYVHIFFCRGVSDTIF